MNRLCIAAVAAALLLVGTAPAAVADDVVSQPVSFAVQNVNSTGVACPTDNKPYTVRGHLTGPESALSAAGPKAGTLYLHGLELGEWFWQVPVDGYNHAEEMAKAGHISVTIDRLGYGASDHPKGTKSCAPAHATVAHQIVSQLRTGGYQGDLHPQFSRVALAGHSLGGLIAEIEAYAFKDVDAIAVISYADTALSVSALFTSAAWGPICGLGGQPSAQGSPGYVFFTQNQAAYRKNFLAKAPPDVFAYGDGLRAKNPCGDLLTAVPVVVTSALRAKQIKVPVLLLTGSKDLVFDANRFALQKPLYGGPTTLRIIPGATHGVTVDADAAQFRDALADWLTDNDF